jgi:hypothetical protein
MVELVGTETRCLVTFSEWGREVYKEFFRSIFSLTSYYRAVSYINQRFYAGLDDSRTIEHLVIPMADEVSSFSYISRIVGLRKTEVPKQKVAIATLMATSQLHSVIYKISLYIFQNVV